MPDHSTTVEELKTAVATFARERDWEQFHAPKNLSMAIAAEAAELMEHYLWSTPEESARVTANADKKAKVAEELADVMILAIQFANMTGIDVSAAMAAKIKSNAEKYPVAKAKGRSSKYNDLT
jgi:dCTP diphosphatase